MCLYPKLIFNRKYISNKKNGGNIPELKDNRVLKVPVGCGNCIECRKQNARNWQVRLHEEIKHTKNGHFVTLTFSDEALHKISEEVKKDLPPEKIIDNEIATYAVRHFLERWRKEFKKSVRHWLITELGHVNTERIHIHGLIFTDNYEDIWRKWEYGTVTIGRRKYFQNGTNNGASKGYVNGQTINYIVKYVTKIDPDHKGYKPKILTSAGIGNNYFNRTDYRHNLYKGKDTNELYRTEQGLKLNLPIYYRNKLYTDDERENLWLNKLDKKERWICGEKIDISKSEDEYYKSLEYYQRKNIRLGYGDNSEDWTVAAYKRERKLLRNKIKEKKQTEKLKKEAENRIIYSKLLNIDEEVCLERFATRLNTKQQENINNNQEY